MNENNVIIERLLMLRNEIVYLKKERDGVKNFSEYQSNDRLRKAVERSLQVAIEICFDIGQNVIKAEGFRYANNYRDIFQVLCDEGIVASELLPQLLKMAGFRNIIVHDYAKVDDAEVYGILKKRLDDFEHYASEIEAYLASI